MVEEEQITVVSIILIKTKDFSWNWFIVLVEDSQVDTRNLDSNLLHFSLLLSLTIQNSDLDNLVLLESFVSGRANSSSGVPVADFVVFNCVLSGLNSLDFTDDLFNVGVNNIQCLKESLDVVIIDVLLFSSSNSIMMLKNTHGFIQSI